MNLSTKIITNNTNQMNKQLSCYFDHPFQIIDPSKTYPTSIATLSNKDITTYIIQKHKISLHKYKCLIVYKIQLDIKLLKHIVEKDQKMVAKIYEYNPKNKKLELKLQFPGQKHYEIQSMDENTLILEISSELNVSRTYFLPHSNGTEQATQLTRAVHQNFKFSRVLNQYLRLQDNCQQIQFSEPILINLKEFLYFNQIKYIEIIIWTQKNKFDMKLLQKIGQLKLPEPWLEKQSYRKKKLQIFELQLEQSKLLNVFKQQKRQFTKNINFLQQITGVPIQPYENISICSLKAIKSKNSSQKISQIQQSEKILKNLQAKLQDMAIKKKQYLQKMTKIQKSHVCQIFELKKQILQLQNQKLNKNCTKSGLIFLKSRKSTQNHVLSTIFGNNDKKMQRMKNLSQEINLSMSQQINNSTNRNNIPIIQSKKQFKNNHKKFANVVKQTGQMKICKASLREKYENQIMKIDFEVQIKNNDLLNRFKDASAYLSKLLVQADDLNI